MNFFNKTFSIICTILLTSIFVSCQDDSSREFIINESSSLSISPEMSFKYGFTVANIENLMDFRNGIYSGGACSDIAKGSKPDNLVFEANKLLNNSSIEAISSKQKWQTVHDVIYNEYNVLRENLDFNQRGCYDIQYVGLKMLQKLYSSRFSNYSEHSIQKTILDQMIAMDAPDLDILADNILQLKDNVSELEYKRYQQYIAKKSRADILDYNENSSALKTEIIENQVGVNKIPFLSEYINLYSAKESAKYAQSILDIAGYVYDNE